MFQFPFLPSAALPAAKPLASQSWRLRRCALFTLLTFAVACKGEPEWRGTAMLPPRSIPPFEFNGSNGRVASTSPVKGTATLLFFGYTNCPDVCGTTLADWVRVKKALGANKQRVRFLFVTVDPARDTPAAMARYIAQFDSTFTGLSGDSATTVAIQQAFGLAALKESAASPMNYLMAHGSHTYLLDDKSRLLVSYAYGAGWDAIAADINAWLD